MERRMLGVIVAGGGPPLEAIGIADDAALTPFAGLQVRHAFGEATMWAAVAATERRIVAAAAG